MPGKFLRYICGVQRASKLTLQRKECGWVACLCEPVGNSETHPGHVGSGGVRVQQLVGHGACAFQKVRQPETQTDFRQARKLLGAAC